MLIGRLLRGRCAPTVETGLTGHISGRIANSLDRNQFTVVKAPDRKGIFTTTFSSNMTERIADDWQHSGRL